MAGAGPRFGAPPSDDAHALGGVEAFLRDLDDDREDGGAAATTADASFPDDTPDGDSSEFLGALRDIDAAEAEFHRLQGELDRVTLEARVADVVGADAVAAMEAKAQEFCDHLSLVIGRKGAIESRLSEPWTGGGVLDVAPKHQQDLVRVLEGAAAMIRGVERHRAVLADARDNAVDFDALDAALRPAPALLAKYRRYLEALLDARAAQRRQFATVCPEVAEQVGITM